MKEEFLLLISSGLKVTNILSLLIRGRELTLARVSSSSKKKYAKLLDDVPLDLEIKLFLREDVIPIEEKIWYYTKENSPVKKGEYIFESKFITKDLIEGTLTMKVNSKKGEITLTFSKEE